jgi:UDP-2-acetamido-2,6-beta-L-arabino-hexul-4-ose reductase
MKVGITGGEGFIGYHTYTYFKYATDFEPIKLNRDFANDKRLKECDWVIHLAGMNRGDDTEIYNTNIDLTSKLLSNIADKTKIIFASSTQADNESSYGKSKRECENMIMDNSPNHKILRLVNVFGPFGKPNYNSFIATFCYKLCNEEQPTIITDNEVELVFVTDAVKEFESVINKEHYKKSTIKIKVSEVLETLSSYKNNYLTGGSIGKLDKGFYSNLFNTFRSYMKPEDRLISTTLHEDDRGGLTELATVSMSEGLVFTSDTNPKFKRGEHFHTRKFERFCVVGGEAIIRMRKIGDNKIDEYRVSGNEIKVIDMPVFYTHHIENIGEGLLRTVFWISELLNKDDADTYWEDV